VLSSIFSREVIASKVVIYCLETCPKERKLINKSSIRIGNARSLTLIYSLAANGPQVDAGVRRVGTDVG